ncbi:MAG: aspartate/tyrosine/aromatic aminotransferase [Pirellulales bacterium]|nr:aspartate/tyrosine/aromatic aminotransferase [Pirellulales bacterium]
MFEQLQPAKPDAILGLTEAFRNDPNPAKINLTVGVYKDDAGQTPVLETVKEAEKRVLSEQKSKGYLPMTGSPEFGQAVQELLFGDGFESLSERARTTQTPGGTGALRVAGDFLHTMFPQATLWLSQPTWPNHPGIFAAAHVPVDTYSYFNVDSNSLDFAGMISKLETLPAGDVVLLHGCCHNPTGVDPSQQQWEQIAAVLRDRGLLPLIDFAYQGFGDGVQEDAAGLRAVCAACDEVLICSSYSKNFSLYNDRIGALTLVARTAEQADTALGHVKLRVRTNYSNPPAHGAAIVKTILSDESLSSDWHGEVDVMRSRIHAMRGLFAATLADKGVEQDFSFMKEQRGMFSFSGLSPQQVETLREEKSIYIVGSGRVNVAGMTADNMELLCESIAGVLGA